MKNLLFLILLVGYLQALVVQTSADLDLKKAVGTFQGVVFYKNAPQKHLIIEGTYKLQNSKLILEATHLKKIPPNKKSKPTTHPLLQVQAVQNLGTMRLKKIAKGSKIYFKEPNLQKMATLLGVDYAQYVASQNVLGVLNPPNSAPTPQNLTVANPQTQTNPTSSKTLSNAPKTSTPRSYQRTTRTPSTRSTRTTRRRTSTTRSHTTSKARTASRRNSQSIKTTTSTHSTRSRTPRTPRSTRSNRTQVASTQNTPPTQRAYPTPNPSNPPISTNPSPSPSSPTYAPSYIPIPESNFIPPRTSPTPSQPTPNTTKPAQNPQATLVAENKDKKENGVKEADKQAPPSQTPKTSMESPTIQHGAGMGEMQEFACGHWTYDDDKLEAYRPSVMRGLDKASGQYLDLSPCNLEADPTSGKSGKIVLAYTQLPDKIEVLGPTTTMHTFKLSRANYSEGRCYKARTRQCLHIEPNSNQEWSSTYSTTTTKITKTYKRPPQVGSALSTEYIKVLEENKAERKSTIKDNGLGLSDQFMEFVEIYQGQYLDDRIKNSPEYVAWKERFVRPGHGTCSQYEIEKLITNKKVLPSIHNTRIICVKSGDFLLENKQP
ncbi:hypothetical protein HBZC1_05490 [Helicobacter bizzozeronii CIII-1]|uniref:Uncharacterized protein n=1 Tax=Helicobacter bizzozeronii (strain CIII-1) TaxID=1002804 RepID=F8KRY5_HELBC|nr:hypothetical protein [Helicobacter bizzozeronii]CCB79535.1 hypothetical protein HBZC1_05490 [Helicobacter bizzozeronii CIII-1]